MTIFEALFVWLMLGLLVAPFVGKLISTPDEYD